MIERAAGEFAVRHAELADLEAILALEDSGFDGATRWSGESWTAELRGADRCVLVADRWLSLLDPGLSDLGSSDPAWWSQRSRQARPTDALMSRQARRAEVGLLGVATFQLVADTADLHRVVVAPEKRGRGIGRALIEAGFTWAAARQGRRMLLEVEHDNDAALALYRRLGFAELARREDYYGAGRHALVMQYDIAGMES